MKNIDKAKQKLKIPGTTCVMCRDETFYISDKSGIKPIMEQIELKTDLHGFAVADKIIGKAAAMMFAFAGVSEIYGEVMSRSALPVLNEYGISYSYGTLTDTIINRAKNGICSMEQTVMNISSLTEAYDSLKQKMLQLSSGTAQK